MADKLKKSDQAGFAAKVPELLRRVEEVNEQKEKAKEYNGLAGKKTKDATENLNFNKWAFTAFCQAKKKEPVEQLDRLLSLFALAAESGMLDQVDMFDDRLTLIRDKLESLLDEGTPAPRPEGAATVAALAAVN